MPSIFPSHPSGYFAAPTQEQAPWSGSATKMRFGCQWNSCSYWCRRKPIGMVQQFFLANYGKAFWCHWVSRSSASNMALGWWGLQQFYRNHQWSPVIPPQNWPLVVSLNSDSSQLYSHDTMFDFSVSQVITDLYWIFFPKKMYLHFFLISDGCPNLSVDTPNTISTATFPIRSRLRV